MRQAVGKIDYIFWTMYICSDKLITDNDNNG